MLIHLHIPLLLLLLPRLLYAILELGVVHKVTSVAPLLMELLVVPLTISLIASKGILRH